MSTTCMVLVSPILISYEACIYSNYALELNNDVKFWIWAHSGYSVCCINELSSIWWLHDSIFFAAGTICYLLRDTSIFCHHCRKSIWEFCLKYCCWTYLHNTWSGWINLIGKTKPLGAPNGLSYACRQSVGQCIVKHTDSTLARYRSRGATCANQSNYIIKILNVTVSRELYSPLYDAVRNSQNALWRYIFKVNYCERFFTYQKNA